MPGSYLCHCTLACFHLIVAHVFQMSHILQVVFEPLLAVKDIRGMSWHILHCSAGVSKNTYQKQDIEKHVCCSCYHRTGKVGSCCALACGLAGM